MSARTFTADLVADEDGDTLRMAITLLASRRKAADLGFSIYLTGRALVLHEPIRLMGLNCAEHGTPGGDAATAWTTAWLTAHPGPYIVQTVPASRTSDDPKQEKWGRYLGTVIAADGHNLNQELLAAGMAAPWDGTGPRPVPPWPIPTP